MSTKSIPKKRTRLAPDQRRQQLIIIGARLFAERPFSDVWVEEVAKEAGVSRGLIYHYFPNKRDFFAEVVRMGAEVSLRITAPDPTLSPVEQMRTGLDNFLEYVVNNEDAFRAIHLGAYSVDDEVRGIVRTVRDIQLKRMLSYISPDREPSPALLFGLEGWMDFNNSVICNWLDNRTLGRDQIVELMSGAFVGILSAALQLDGGADAEWALPDNS